MGSPDDRGKEQDSETGKAETTDRRTDVRHPSDQPATIKFLNPVQSSADVSARVLEISRGGLKLRVNRPLMPGTLVQIRFGGKLLMGEVRHCDPAGDEYHAGIRLQDVFDTGL